MQHIDVSAVQGGAFFIQRDSFCGFFGLGGLSSLGNQPEQAVDDRRIYIGFAPLAGSAAVAVDGKIIVFLGSVYLRLVADRFILSLAPDIRLYIRLGADIVVQSQRLVTAKNTASHVHIHIDGHGDLHHVYRVGHAQDKIHITAEKCASLHRFAHVFHQFLFRHFSAAGARKADGCRQYGGHHQFFLITFHKCSPFPDRISVSI